MDMKQLQSFTAVVRYRSFTKAAERLYLSQPTISTHIRNLEEELGTCLIVRTKRSVDVTPRGQELYECACNILSLRDNLIRRWSSNESSIIQLGASTIPSAYILPEILPAYGKEHPEAYFTIHQSDSRGVEEGLLNGSFDLGMAGNESAEPALRSVPFYRDRMVLVTPVTRHFLALKESGAGPLDILRQEPVILREQAGGERKSADYFLAEMGFREEALKVAARVNDQESVKNLAAGGVGVSIISRRAARDFIREKRLLAFDLPGEAAGRNLCLIFRKDYILKREIRDFMAFVKSFYAEMP